MLKLNMSHQAYDTDAARSRGSSLITSHSKQPKQTWSSTSSDTKVRPVVLGPVLIPCPVPCAMSLSNSLFLSLLLSSGNHEWRPK